MSTTSGERARGRAEKRGKKEADGSALRGKVRPHDPFELIRWLALSQPDPRKALAELVQNSLDAGAGRVRVTRVRERGVPCLRIFDDGEGVIPSLGRPEALKYIATHIGHSRKRSLSPQERLTLMTQGQYGIGLLGFWSLGERLEMRSHLPGQPAYRLVLQRDRPDYLIEKLRGRLPTDDRWTEVIVVGLDREAQAALVARRAADYLASELRGQLLARDVELTLSDRMTRGRGLKDVRVRPPRFLGERLQGIGPLEIPGHPPVRFEVYLTGDDARSDGARPLAIYAAGTLVAESFAELGALDLDHPPWTDPRLTGIVDFPGLHVAPGSRRGVVVDGAAGAFAHALRVLEPILQGVLDALDRERREELDRTLIRDLQRAFRDLYRHQPRYAMLPVRERNDEGGGPSTQDGGSPGAAGVGAPHGAPASSDGSDTDVTEAVAPTPLPDLLPPGPLATLRPRPASLRLLPGMTRELRVAALDESGRPVAGPVSFETRPLGERLFEVEPERCEDGRFRVTAAAALGEGLLEVTATSAGHAAACQVSVTVADVLAASRSDEGIPEPELVDQPGARWRSRMDGDRWQVNTGHPDYREAAERPALKLRYLSMLFAKEIVLRSNQDPRLEAPLEQMVEVAAYADRNVTRSASVKRRGRTARARNGDA